MSDFPRSAARLTEGFCPLCDVHLRDHTVNQVDARPGETLDSINAEIGPTEGYVICFRCRIGWRPDMIDGRLALFSSRPLTPSQIRHLYDNRKPMTP